MSISFISNKEDELNEIIDNKVKDIVSHFGTYKNNLVLLKDKNKKFITKKIFSYFVKKCIEFGYNLSKRNNMKRDNKVNTLNDGKGVEVLETVIPIPEGYEIDKEKSTFERIIFKKKVKRFIDDVDAKINGYWISSTAEILKAKNYSNNNRNVIFATERLAKSALAMARISQIMANDERFGGKIIDVEWDTDTYKYILARRVNDIYVEISKSVYQFLAFHTREQAELFLEENKQLVKDYYCI